MSASPRIPRSFSDTHQTQRYLPPFSSSNYSYFSSPSYVNSITLPAAPVLLGGSSVSSIKKKKRRSLLRISNASSDFFQQFSSDSKDSDNMLTVAPDASTNNVTNNRNSMSSDIELATEIGQGLLSEVRRMQSILQERHDTLIMLEQEKKENEHRIDDLTKQVRFKNETEERLKEDIWNLELTKQDLSHHIRQLSQTLSKSHMDKVRRERQENLVHQELELMKTAQIEWQDVIDKTQSEYEAKLTTLNQSLLKLKNEKETIALQLEQLTTSIARAKKKETELKKQKPSAEELHASQLSLVQAQSVAEALKVDLETEKQKSCEIYAMSRVFQETIEQMKKTDPSSATVSEKPAAACCQDVAASTVKDSVTTVVDESSTATVTSSIHYLPCSLEEEISNVTHQEQDSQESSINMFSSMLMKEPCSTNPSSASVTNYDTQQNAGYTDGVYLEQPIYPPTLPLTKSNGFEKMLPFVMHTMIGEWLYKYTRYHIRNGISNKSHPRFFWLHPYTKTLYWSEKQPGVQGGEINAKSGKLIIANLFVNTHRIYLSMCLQFPLNPSVLTIRNKVVQISQSSLSNHSNEISRYSALATTLM